MKNSGVEWIGEIPDEWEVSKIGQLYEERITKVSDTVYPPLSVTMQGILPQLENAAKSDAHDDRKLVLKGDFAINSRSDRRGSCGISNFNGSVSLINTVLHPKTEMNPIYYNWLFHSFRFSDEYYKNGHGIVDDLWTTSWSEMKKIFIPLPPKETQQRIASYLDKKCSKIEETIQNQQQVIEKLKAYKQSLITEAVTGKVKIVNGKACGEYESYKDSGVEWIGKIPSEWKKCKFTRIIIDTRNGLSRRDLNKSTGNLVLKLKNINPDGNIDLTETNRIELSKNEIQNYQLQNDDFLFVRVNGSKSLVGKCAIYKTIENIVAYNDHIIRVRFNLNLCNVYYIKYLLQSSYAKYDIANHIKTAAGQFTISSEDLCNLICLLPSIDEQKSIADYLNKKCLVIDNAIEQKQKLIEKLAEYKKSLIYEVVTGKRIV